MARNARPQIGTSVIHVLCRSFMDIGLSTNTQTEKRVRHSKAHTKKKKMFIVVVAHRRFASTSSCFYSLSLSLSFLFITHSHSKKDRSKDETFSNDLTRGEKGDGMRRSPIFVYMNVHERWLGDACVALPIYVLCTIFSLYIHI